MGCMHGWMAARVDTVESFAKHLMHVRERDDEPGASAR